MPKSMSNGASTVKPFVNQDIVESLRNRDRLEDSIFQQLEKIQALSEAQRIIDVNETALSAKGRQFYSIVLDDHVQELRKLLDRCFS